MSTHRTLIIETARQMGIEVTDLQDEWQMDAIRLEWGGHRELMLNEGLCLASLSHHAWLIGNHKFAFKKMLTEMGIPSPASIVVASADQMQTLVTAFMQQYRPVVCKPIDGTEGVGVLTDIQDLQEALAHCDFLLQKGCRVLLEEHVQGDDLRIFVIDGEPVAACRRVPARVTGDGVSSLDLLIEKERARVKKDNPENNLDIDTQLLKKQQVSLNEVIAAGRVIHLRNLANMAQGALAVDITDEIHPEYALWTRAVAQALKMPIFSLDVLTTDHRIKPGDHSRVLEINVESAWFHHTFSQVRQHDFPRLILKRLFNMP